MGGTETTRLFDRAAEEAMLYAKFHIQIEKFSSESNEVTKAFDQAFLGYLPVD